MSSVLVVFSLAAVSGVGLAVAASRVPVVRTGLQVLGGISIVFVALFAIASPTSDLVWATEATAVDGLAIDDPAPVIVLVFDELPLASIIDAEGNINAGLYPNYARLAEDGTWFRNSWTTSATTTRSVPIALSGFATGGVPSSIGWPENIFTLLGDRYSVNAYEPATRLCPTSVCDESQPDPTREETASATFTSSLKDLAVVYGHQALPGTLADDLPSIDNSWGNFGDDDTLAPSEPVTEATAPEDQEIHDRMEEDVLDEWRNLEGRGPGSQMAAMREVIDSIDGDETEALYVAHSVFPHAPWRVMPDTTVADRGFTMETDGGSWADDEELLRGSYQGQLLQIGATDTIIGELIDKLETEGIWDEAIVVVLADHGASFEAGAERRKWNGSNEDALYRTPLIIKAPGHANGDVSDVNARLEDVVPTIAAALGVDVDWEFDGRDLFGNAPPPDGREMNWYDEWHDADPTVDGLFETAAENALLVPQGDDWSDVVALGRSGYLVGTPVASTRVAAKTGVVWTLEPDARHGDTDPYANVETASLPPAIVRGHLELPADSAPPTEVVLAVNGTLSGVAAYLRESEPGRWTFEAVMDWRLLSDGANEVEVFIANPGQGDGVQLRRATRQ